MINSKTDLTAASHLKALSRSHSSCYSITHSKGASLIEVLVALIILSIGVLGIVGLQLISSKVNQTNQNFIQAALVTNNLASRIQLNKNSVLNDLSIGINNPYLSTNSYDFSSFSSCESSNYICYCQQPPSAIQTCRTNNQGSFNLCNGEQLAQFDTYEISCMLALISNEVKVVIYSSFNDDGIALLDINILWANQAEELANYQAQSSCGLATQELNGELLCYSQQLIIADGRHES